MRQPSTSIENGAKNSENELCTHWPISTFVIKQALLHNYDPDEITNKGQNRSCTITLKYQAKD